MEQQDGKNPAVGASNLTERLGCDCCGGLMVYVRGRHPGMDNRLVCPTCMAETLDDIKQRMETAHRKIYQAP